MTETAARRLIAQLSFGVLLTAIIIVVLTWYGNNLQFSHMFGYAIGMGMFLILNSIGNRQVSDLLTADAIANLAASYAFSLLALTVLSIFFVHNAYVAQLLSAIVFFVFVVFLQMASRRATSVISQMPLQKVAKLSIGVLIACLGIAAIVSLIAFDRSLGDLSILNVSGRVQWWIESAKCFAKTGKILTICTEAGQVMPLEDYGLSDDRGTTLLLSLAHGWFGAANDKQTISIINFIVSIGGIAIFGWQLARNGFAVGGLIVSLSGVVICNAYLPGPDAPSSYLGLFALALVMPVQLLRMLRSKRIGLGDWMWFAASIAILSFIALMRQPFGIMAIGVSGLAILFRLIAPPQQWSVERLAIIIATLGSFYLATHATQLLISARATFQGIPQGAGMLTHGIAHNLYLGLGSEPNSFGIEFDDNNGIAAVKRVDPTLLYGSRAYYNKILELYFEIVRHHPAEVARIYAAKIGKSFGLIVLPVSLLLIACIAFERALARRLDIETSVQAVEFVVLVCSLIVLNTLQGVLAFPSGNNFPSLIGFAALFGIGVDGWFKIMQAKN
jgi:hypothetical protein